MYTLRSVRIYEAKLIAEANQSVDTNPAMDPFGTGQSRHLNKDLDFMFFGDSSKSTIADWVHYEYSESLRLKNEGKLDDSLKHLGYAMHSLQDFYSHTASVTNCHKGLYICEHLSSMEVDKGDKASDGKRKMVESESKALMNFYREGKALPDTRNK